MFAEKTERMLNKKQTDSGDAEVGVEHTSDEQLAMVKIDF